MKKREELLLADAIGNLYRAAFFLARGAKEKKSAGRMLEGAIRVLEQFNRKESVVLAKLHQQIGKIKTKKQRLVLAEQILDEYKKLVYCLGSNRTGRLRP